MELDKKLIWKEVNKMATRRATGRAGRPRTTTQRRARHTARFGASSPLPTRRGRNRK